MVSNTAQSVATPSANWQKLKQTLPTSASTQKYLKKRKFEEFARSQVPENKKMQNSSALAPGKQQKEMLEVFDSVSPTSADAGKYVSLDCEFVGVGQSGTASSLARVSIVNFHGRLLYDTFVRQKERVTDYRTWVSGIRPGDLKGAPTFEEVVKKVEEVVRGRVLVGHAVYNDLQVLLLSHPRAMTRDTSLYAPLQTLAKTKRPALRNLAKLVLNMDIQSGEHSSIEDARTTMAIYRIYKDEWEHSLKMKKKGSKPEPPKLPSAAAIDPTRRFKHSRHLGLAAIARASDLLPSTASEPSGPDGSEEALRSQKLAAEQTLLSSPGGGIANGEAPALDLNISATNPIPLQSTSTFVAQTTSTNETTTTNAKKTDKLRREKKKPVIAKNAATPLSKPKTKASNDDQWWLKPP